MANLKQINKRRRQLASDLFQHFVKARNSPLTKEQVMTWASDACEMANALIHEFDERDWQ